MKNMGKLSALSNPQTSYETSVYPPLHKKGILFFFRLAIFGGFPTMNPIAARVVKRQNTIEQILILLTMSLILCLPVFMFKLMGGDGPPTALTFLLCWFFMELGNSAFSTGELIDHVIRWRTRKTFDDIVLSSISPGELVAGLAGPSISVAACSLILSCLIFLLTPAGIGDGFLSANNVFSSPWSEVILWRLGLTAGLFITVFASMCLSAIRTFPKTLRSVSLNTDRLNIKLSFQNVTAIILINLTTILIISLPVFLLNHTDLFKVRPAGNLQGGVILVSAFLSAFIKFQLASRFWIQSEMIAEKYVTPE